MSKREIDLLFSDDKNQCKGPQEGTPKLQELIFSVMLSDNSRINPVKFQEFAHLIGIPRGYE